MAKKIRDLENGKELFGYDLKDTTVKSISEYEIEIVGSTGVIDRDGEVLDPSGWDLKNYKKNPVILPAHNYHAPAIGRAKNIKVNDGQLNFRIEFPQEGINPVADIYRKLYKSGFMKASSVGFVPIEWKNGSGDKEPRRTYTKQELLELSLVSVPANPQALVTAKGFGEAVSKGVLSNDEVEFLKSELAKWGKKDDDSESQPNANEAGEKPEETPGEEVQKPEASEEAPEVVETEDGKRLVIEMVKGKKFEGKDILVSANEGVFAFYDEETKTINSYLFDLSKEWTTEKAEKFIEGHQRFMYKAIATKKPTVEKFNLKQIIKSDWDGFKEVVFDALKELQSEGLYNDLLFGKVGKEDPKEPVLEKQEVVDIVKEFLDENKGS